MYIYDLRALVYNLGRFHNLRLWGRGSLGLLGSYRGGRSLALIVRIIECSEKV